MSRRSASWFGVAVLLATPAMAGGGGDLAAVKALLAAPEPQLDLVKAKLLIDKLIEPSTDVESAAKQLDAMAKALKARFPPNATSHDKVEALREFLYKAGAWNGGKPFSYDFEDPFGRNIHNKLLTTYLSTRKGNCVSMPILFLLLGQRVGIDLTTATAPEHVFVKYRDEKGVVVNLEATSGGGVTSDAWIQHEMPMTPQALANGVYLRPLSKKETVAVMLGTLMEWYGRHDRQEDRIAVAQMALEVNAKDTTAMLHIHGAYGQMVEKDFQSRYATPRDIPPEQRATYIKLASASQQWRQRAEDLGWREPEQDTEEQYRQKVNVVKSAQ